MYAAEIQLIIRSKRLAAFDFGLRRVGWAVCDEFHITTTPKGVLYRTDERFWDTLLEGLNKERISVCLVGVPYRDDNQQTTLIEKIREFIVELKSRSSLPVIEVDENYTSKRAVQTMVEIGVPKARRRSKERTDEIAAAIMLRDFLAEIE